VESESQRNANERRQRRWHALHTTSVAMWVHTSRLAEMLPNRTMDHTWCSRQPLEGYGPLVHGGAMPFPLGWSREWMRKKDVQTHLSSP
jgi:hypothetical protein